MHERPRVTQPKVAETTLLNLRPPSTVSEFNTSLRHIYLYGPFWPLQRLQLLNFGYLELPNWRSGFSKDNVCDTIHFPLVLNVQHSLTDNFSTLHLPSLVQALIISKDATHGFRLQNSVQLEELEEGVPFPLFGQRTRAQCPRTEPFSPTIPLMCAHVHIRPVPQSMLDLELSGGKNHVGFGSHTEFDPKQVLKDS